MLPRWVRVTVAVLYECFEEQTFIANCVEGFVDL